MIRISIHSKILSFMDMIMIEEMYILVLTKDLIGIMIPLVLAISWIMINQLQYIV